MKVFVVAIVNQYGQEQDTKVFSSQEKADEYLYEHVKSVWHDHYDEGECPEDRDEAINEFFNGGIAEDNLICGEYVVDEID